MRSVFDVHSGLQQLLTEHVSCGIVPALTRLFTLLQRQLNHRAASGAPTEVLARGQLPRRIEGVAAKDRRAPRLPGNEVLDASAGGVVQPKRHRARVPTPVADLLST